MNSATIAIAGIAAATFTASSEARHGRSPHHAPTNAFFNPGTYLIQSEYRHELTISSAMNAIVRHDCVASASSNAAPNNTATRCRT